MEGDASKTARGGQGQCPCPPQGEGQWLQGTTAFACWRCRQCVLPAAAEDAVYRVPGQVIEVARLGQSDASRKYEHGQKPQSASWAMGMPFITRLSGRLGLVRRTHWLDSSAFNGVLETETLSVTPQSKVLELWWSRRVELNIYRTSAFPLIASGPVAQLWADYSGANRTLSRLSWEAAGAGSSKIPGISVPAFSGYYAT